MTTPAAPSPPASPPSASPAAPAVPAEVIDLPPALADRLAATGRAVTVSGTVTASTPDGLLSVRLPDGTATIKIDQPAQTGRQITLILTPPTATTAPSRPAPPTIQLPVVDGLAKGSSPPARIGVQAVATGPAIAVRPTDGAAPRQQIGVPAPQGTPSAAPGGQPAAHPHGNSAPVTSQTSGVPTGQPGPVRAAAQPSGIERQATQPGASSPPQGARIPATPPGANERTVDARPAQPPAATTVRPQLHAPASRLVPLATSGTNAKSPAPPAPVWSAPSNPIPIGNGVGASASPTQAAQTASTKLAGTVATPPSTNGAPVTDTARPGQTLAPGQRAFAHTQPGGQTVQNSSTREPAATIPAGAAKPSPAATQPQNAPTAPTGTVTGQPSNGQQVRQPPLPTNTSYGQTGSASPDAAPAGQKSPPTARTPTPAPVALAPATVQSSPEAEAKLQSDQGGGLKQVLATLTARLGARPAASAPAIPAFEAIDDGQPGVLRLGTVADLIAASSPLDPAGLTVARSHPVPQPGAQLGASLMFFVAALRGGNVRTWIGERAAVTLDSLGSGDLVTRLSGEFLAASRGLADPGPGEWRSLSIPLLHEQYLNELRLHYRDDRRRGGDGDGKDAGGKRIMVDFTLSRSGPMRLDGLLGHKRFDLLVRSMSALPQWMQNDIACLFASACEASGLAGAVGFKTGPDGWIAPTGDDRPTGLSEFA